MHHESRKIDLDILTFNDLIITNETLDLNEDNYYLNIPHIRINERLFVLKPLFDIDPNFRFYSRKTKKFENVQDLIIELLVTNINKDLNFKKHFHNKEINSMESIDYLSIVTNFCNLSDYNNEYILSQFFFL